MKKRKPRTKFCNFPGCEGGCHFCTAVQAQRKNAPIHEVALRVLRESADPDAIYLAEIVKSITRPLVDTKTGKWL